MAEEALGLREDKTKTSTQDMKHDDYYIIIPLQSSYSYLWANLQTPHSRLLAT